MNRLTIVATNGRKIIRVHEDFCGPRSGLAAWSRLAHRLDKILGGSKWEIVSGRVHAAPPQPFRGWVPRLSYGEVLMNATRCAW